MFSFKDFVYKIGKFRYFIIAFVISIWTLPYPIILPGSGLDPSWILGINIAFLENFQFGKDIAFTFGPLGFLCLPVTLDYNTWTISLLFSIFTHFLFVGVIFCFIKNFTTKFSDYLIMIPILIFVIPPIEYKLILVALMTLYLFLINSRSTHESLLLIPFAGLLLSIGTLIKFNSFLMSISIIVMFFLSCILAKKSIKYAIYLLGSYCILLTFIWLAAGQDITNLSGYFYSGIELSTGYSDSMATFGSKWQILVLFCSVLAFVVTLAYSIKEDKKEILIFLFLNLGILFFAFKHGFVRQDNVHVLTFFQISLLFFALILIMIFKSENIRKLNYINFANIFVIILLLLSINHSMPGVLNDNIVSKSSSYHLAEKLLISPNYFNEYSMSVKNNVRENYFLDPSTVEYIENKTVDIFPWDISLAWAYNFNWSPRPVFQSYSAYTQYLDLLNSRHFIDYDSPKTILYSYKSIDGRYPSFDEPATFRNILCNYSFVNKSGEFLLLTYNPQIMNKKSEVDLGNINSSMGSIISVPKYSEGYVFGYIDVEYSFIGKIMKFLYKPSTCFIQFKLRDNSYSQEFKFIPSTAKNGVFLSQFIINQDDLSLIFQGHCINNIEGVILKTDNPLQYSDNIKLNFVGVPANVLIWENVLTPNRERLVSPISIGAKEINNEYKIGIFEHPSNNFRTIIEYDNIPISKQAKLKFSITLDPQVYSPDKGDGVVFEIYVNGIDSKNLLFSKYIDPKHNINERKWNEFEVDLSDFEGQNINLVFSTLPGPANNTDYDWAWWGFPIQKDCFLFM